ncbi:MAG: HigA family addiction module antidote protein [Planctomycetes bacterium]|nr:HigA family addiction module antidote protein [Planctomycetota bacterium]MCD7897121.1 HigA family addiction module antitoxin [Planctomycetaceae bacterium]
MLPNNRIVVHPGQMLLEGYLEPMGLSQAEFARQTGIPAPAVSEIIMGKRRVSSRLAIILGDALGTGPEFWIRLQADHDFTRDREKMRRLKKLPKPVKSVQSVVVE